MNSNKQHAYSLCDNIWPRFTIAELQKQISNTPFNERTHNTYMHVHKLKPLILGHGTQKENHES